MSNKLNFQTEFYRLTTVEGIARDEAAVQAIKNISFGSHRAGAGYGDFEVKLTGTVVVELKDFGKQRVPKSISVVAWSTDGGRTE